MMKKQSAILCVVLLMLSLGPRGIPFLARSEDGAMPIARERESGAGNVAPAAAKNGAGNRPETGAWLTAQTEPSPRPDNGGGEGEQEQTEEPTEEPSPPAETDGDGQAEATPEPDGTEETQAPENETPSEPPTAWEPEASPEPEETFVPASPSMPEETEQGPAESGMPETEEQPTNIPPGGMGAPPSQQTRNQMVVYSFGDLKQALEEDNGITTVYFGGDIQGELGGIQIHPNKKQVVVSGRNPAEPERAEPYTLTDYRSALFTDAIRINRVGVSSLTVRDMIIVGKNYYGPFSVLDTPLMSGVTVTYERVRYNGPQLGYHRAGTVRVRDCEALIHGRNGGSVNQEFSEAKHLLFEGGNSIHTESSGFSIFWHPLGGSFALADDASLTVMSPNTSVLYGVFYADIPSAKVSVTIGRRGKLDMTISEEAATVAHVSLNVFTVREAGQFSLRTTKAVGGAVLRIAGDLRVEREARFTINGYGGSNDTLLVQESGDLTVLRDALFHLSGENPCESLLELAGRSFVCDDPSSVLLRNGNRPIIATLRAARFTANARQLNYWDALHPGGLDSPPPRRWDGAGSGNVLMEGSLNIGANGNWSSFTAGGYVAAPPTPALDGDSFHMKNARILAWGRLEMTVAPLTAGSTAVSGVTEPGAMVRVMLSGPSGNTVLPDVTADAAGVFRVPVNGVLGEGATVTVLCSWNYLTAEETIAAEGGGSLSMTVPKKMEFFTSDISSFPQTIKRLRSDWEIIVSDGRQNGGWRLYVRLGRAMTPAGEGLSPLEDALVLAGDEGEPLPLTDADTLIAARATDGGGEVRPVSWPEDKGILLFVKPGTAVSEVIYQGGLEWTLMDTP